VFKNATARFDIITLKAMLLFDVIPSDCTKRGKIAVRIVDKIKNESWWQNLNKQSTAVVFAVFMPLSDSNNSASRPVVGGRVPDSEQPPLSAGHQEFQKNGKRGQLAVAVARCSSHPSYFP
jgi:hypothetical protein